MAGTQIKGNQIEDGTISRADLNITTTGQAVIRKIIALNGVAILTSSGVDTGTGDVSIQSDLTYLDTKYVSRTQTIAQNAVLAGPVSGSGVPAFRALTAGDIPPLSQYELLTNKATVFTTVNNTLYPSTLAVANQFVNGLSIGNSNFSYGSSTNTTFDMSPLNNDWSWHDVFAFTTSRIAYETTTDYGVNWTNTGITDTGFKKLLQQKQAIQAFVLTNTSGVLNGFRATFNGLAYGQMAWINLSIIYTPSVPSIDVTIEQSADNTTWTTLHLTVNRTVNVSGTGNWFKLNSLPSQTYVRVTVVANSASTSDSTLSIASLRGMSNRGGVQGFGKENEYPYTWTEDKYMSFVVPTITSPSGYNVAMLSSTGQLTSGTLANMLDANYIKQGGNSLGATMIIGTNDNNELYFKANNSNVARIAPLGFFRVNNNIFANWTTVNNSQLTLSDTGSQITRNVADTNTTLVVNQINTSATGHLQTWQQGGVNKAAIDYNGFGKFNKIAINSTLASPTAFLDVDAGTVASNVRLFWFKQNGGDLSLFNNSTTSGVWGTVLRSTSVGVSDYGMRIISRGADTYSNAAITLESYNAAYTGAITSGNILRVLNGATVYFTVDYSGVVTIPNLSNSVASIVTSSTTGVLSRTNIVPVGNGGTGLSSAGASGNILVSNGISWVSQTPTFVSSNVYTTDGTLTSNRTINGGNYDLTLTNINSYLIFTNGDMIANVGTSISNSVQIISAGNMYLSSYSEPVLASNGEYSFAFANPDGIRGKFFTTNLSYHRNWEFPDASGTIALYETQVISASVIGTTTKTLSLFLGGGGTPITASWTDLNAGGTVTSVGLSMPSLFTVSGSPITSSGTLTATLASQAANTFFANNTSASAVPAFGAMAALTSTNDTNITISLGGTPATSLFKAVSLTMGWTGVLAAARGGTGLSTVGTSGQVLVSNGTSWVLTTPTWTSNTGTVTSVTGTSNRITITTGTTTPVIDIASTYVGQTSITTLGTITTGTWNGTAVGVANGGTGATTLTGILLGNGTSAVMALASSTANQLLRRNAANTGYEFFTPTYVTSSGVTSVGLTVPTGLAVSPATITSTGTFAVTFATGYSIPTTASQSNWNTAYSWGNHATVGYVTSNIYIADGILNSNRTLNGDGYNFTINGAGILTFNAFSFGLTTSSDAAISSSSLTLHATNTINATATDLSLSSVNEPVLASDNTYSFAFRNLDGYKAHFLTSNVTYHRNYEFPDVDGTIALLSDITSNSISDTYTPAVTGSDVYIPSVFYFTRIDNIVSVSGSVQVNAIGSVGVHNFLVELPIPTTVSNIQDLTGLVSGSFNPSSIGTQRNYVRAYFGSNEANVSFTTDDSSALVFMQFTYLIN